MSAEIRPSRRAVLAGASAALATLAPGMRVSFATDGQSGGDILVVLFMRGGQDGLQVLAPAGDPQYIARRPSMRVTADGPNAGLGAGTLDGTDFYLHPNVPGLKRLYDAGKLAAVQAVGIPTVDRSHFTCQDMMEEGLADNETVKGANGWLARHLASRAGARAPLGTIAVGTANPMSLAGDPLAFAMSSADSFAVLGGDRDTAMLVRNANAGTNPYQIAVRSLIDNVNSVQDKLQTAGAPTGAAPDYGFSAFGDALQSLAQIIKLDLGLDTATLDMASWDHHTVLANAFGLIATDLDNALSAFWQDLSAFQSRLTIVTMTEFGRRFTQNSNSGLDHGAGSTMLVVGGNVAGGKIYGHWPGLSSTALDNDSLRVTTDYRQVLGELLVKRHGERNLGQVFPTLTYAPLGLLR
ncbi:MAG: DUF1501 domain-containing protein [Candidatus Binataceae bacterium]